MLLVKCNEISVQNSLLELETEGINFSLKENRKKQFSCFPLLFKEPYKGKDLPA